MQVRKTGSKAFVQRVRLNAKYIDIGLGGYSRTTLAKAHKMVAENRIQAAKWEDPKMKKPLVIPTFVKVQRNSLV